MHQSRASTARAIVVMINLLEKYHCQIPIIQVVSVMEKTALKFRVG